MEELRARLDGIKEDMKELETVTNIIKRQESILNCIDSVNKEVL